MTQNTQVDYLKKLGGFHSISPIQSIPNCPGAFRIQGTLSGPRVCIFGGIHGHEPCGAVAIERLLEDIASGRIFITRGTLTLAVANIEGLKIGKRSIDHNLNRVFRDDLLLDTNSYEHRRVSELAPLLHETDYFLDLHATSAPTSPFLMCERPVLEEAKKLGFETIVVGWSELGDPSTAGDTETYANKHGAKSFTLECGQRDDIASFNVAYLAVLRLLKFTGLLSLEPTQTDNSKTSRVLSLFGVERKRGKDFVYTRNFCNFDRLRSGELIARDESGEYRAPRDCVLIMPASPEVAAVGEDIYQLAEECLS